MNPVHDAVYILSPKLRLQDDKAAANSHTIEDHVGQQGGLHDNQFHARVPDFRTHPAVGDETPYAFNFADYRKTPSSDLACIGNHGGLIGESRLGL